VSREEAHRRPAVSRKRPPTGPAAAGRTAEEAVRPRAPLFTARTDPTAGVICTRGHLDREGAEVLCRTVTALQQLGHRQIVVRLGPGTVADDVRALLTDLAARLRIDGVALLLR
jgi:hypothetical protein